MIKFLKIIGILSLLLVIGYYASIYFIMKSLKGIIEPDPGSMTEQFIDNFEQQKQAILDARDYFIYIAPENPGMTFEFYGKSSGQIAMRDHDAHNKQYYRKADSLKLDALLTQLNWTRSNLDTLIGKMDEANCYSIQGRNPVRIGWQGRGNGIYYYSIFAEDLDEDQITLHSDNCRYIYYGENIVLEYESVNTSPDCFPLKER